MAVGPQHITPPEPPAAATPSVHHMHCPLPVSHSCTQPSPHTAATRMPQLPLPDQQPTTSRHCKRGVCASAVGGTVVCSMLAAVT